MKRLHITSIVLIAGILSACGGGGGDGGGGGGTAETPDGKKFDLEISAKGTVEGNTPEGRLFGQNNADSFYGVWRNDAKTLRELRYQGTEATNIPTSGVATYKGDAVWISGYDNSFQKGGNTTLKVDFDEKTVNGKITFSIFNGDEFRRDITLHTGSLSGASFAGRASVLGNRGGQYQGALFGDGAKEAAGLVQFKNNSSLDVSFGGKKQ